MEARERGLGDDVRPTLLPGRDDLIEGLMLEIA